MVELFKKSSIPTEEVSEILRICAKQMNETLVISDSKNKNKIKSLFEIEQKYEEINQRMSEMNGMDMFGTASTDGQRYILEWVLGQHDNDELLEKDILK